jgi:1,3-propanediol dehydrogenase
MARLANWNQFCPTFFGTGASELIGEKAKAMGMSKILLVTENDLVKFGVATKVQKQLEAAGLTVILFDKVKIDPPSDICDAGYALAVAEKVDGIVAVGGGSSIDTSKAIALLTGNPGDHIKKYFGQGSVGIKRGIPLITIPTTAGTGSENTQYAVITDVETHLKEVPEYRPDLALVDPVLTYTLPKSQTAATGMDALAHCCESITSKFWNPYANVFAAEGIRICLKWLPVAVREPNNAEAREKMSFAANLGGMAITPCSCHLGHAWSQCFGGKYHVPHGLGCAWGLPGAMWFAGKWAPKDSRIVADAMGIKYTEKTTPDELAKLITKKIVALMREIGIPTLKSQGYTLDDCQSVAQNVLHDAGFAGSPKENTTVDDVKEFVKVTYESYQ